MGKPSRKDPQWDLVFTSVLIMSALLGADVGIFLESSLNAVVYGATWTTPVASGVLLFMFLAVVVVLNIISQNGSRSKYSNSHDLRNVTICTIVSAVITVLVIVL